MMDRNNVFYNFFANITQSKQNIIPSSDFNQLFPVIEAVLKTRNWNFELYESEKYGLLKIIDVAIIIDDINVVKYLIDTIKLDVNSKTSTGASLLHLAVLFDKTDNSEMVNFLIARGAEVNARDNNEKTPLQYLDQYFISNTPDALLLKYLAHSRILVEHKADCSMFDAKDMWARGWAIAQEKGAVFIWKLCQMVPELKVMLPDFMKGFSNTQSETPDKTHGMEDIFGDTKDNLVDDNSKSHTDN